MSNITSDASNLERLTDGIVHESFYKRPFCWGPGTYSLVYVFKVQNLTIISTNFGDGGNAHSEYLGPLAEQGFLVFLLTLFLL